MPAVVIRNIPIETHRALKKRARENGLSTEAEIRSILTRAVELPVPFVSAFDLFSQGPHEAAEIDLELPEREHSAFTVACD